jgi:hypothetical protein
MKILRSFSCIIVGIVFIFSGFVKAVDPLGSTYKFTDYFSAFGMDFLAWSAFPLAVVLSGTELVMGISLLLRYRMKTISWAILVFISFFTVLTFILAIFNPVTDCGCFGDALILTNWQTFWKNIVLMVFTLVIFTGRNTFIPIRGAYAEWGILTFFFIGVFSLSIYCKNHLPILDFMPYKTGTNIPAASSVPPGAPSDVYETRLFYRNLSDEKISEFTIENFPKDSGWQFVDSKSILISEGYKPPIHDFSISDPNGEDLTESIKNEKGFVFLLISYNLKKADSNGLKKANDFYKLSGLFQNVKFFAATSSLDSDIRNIRDSLDLNYDFGSADEIALKTIIRSNPGMLLMKDGTIIGKWHYKDFPKFSDFGKDFEKLIVEFPLTPGTDLRNLKTPPDGARSDVYHTSLVYRNILNDSIETFSMENFPKEKNWVFVSSHSEKVESGFVSPIEDLKLFTAQGEDLADKILQQTGDVFLISAREPHNLDPEILSRLNNLSMFGASLPQGPMFFYAMTGLAADQLYGFADSFISPITFCSGNLRFVESVSGSGVSLIHLKDGIVIERWDNNKIPGPEEFQKSLSSFPQPRDFESSVMPYLFNNSRISIEEKRIYILILGFLFLSLFIRVFFEDPFGKQV